MNVRLGLGEGQDRRVGALDAPRDGLVIDSDATVNAVIPGCSWQPRPLPPLPDVDPVSAGAKSTVTAVDSGRGRLGRRPLRRLWVLSLYGAFGK